MSHHQPSTTLPPIAPWRLSIFEDHSREQSVVRTKSPVLNTDGPNKVVQAIQDVLREQQKKGVLKLAYLPKGVKAARTSWDIRLQHLSDKGRSLEDRLRHGLASLFVAEKYCNWQ